MTNNKEIEAYVKKWIEGHEPETFVRNEHGVIIYKAGHSSINLESFFENLLEDFVNDNEVTLTKK